MPRRGAHSGDEAGGGVEDKSVAELLKSKDFIVFHDVDAHKKWSLRGKTDQFDALDLSVAPKAKQPQSAKIDVHSASYRSIRVPQHRSV